MKIRSRLIVSALVALCVAMSSSVVLWGAVRQAQSSEEDLLRAQVVSREVSNLLVLTQEYASHFEQRAQQQWLQRLQTLKTALTQAPGSSASSSALATMNEHVTRLPILFARLAELGDQGVSPFVERRRQFLLDQLLTDTQALADGAARWSERTVEAQRQSSAKLHQTAGVVLATFVIMMLWQGWWLARRVLKPLAELERATFAIEEGRLDVQLASIARDELGSLARRFNAMTRALAERTAQVEAEAQLRLQSERRIRTITDNMPALISYIDRDRRYRFTNAYYKTIFGVDPASFIGKTIEEGIGPEAYEELEPHLRSAFEGQQVKFERTAVERGVEVHFLVDYQPDVDQDGRVVGIYVMVLDITARKKSELTQAESEEKMRAILTHAPDAFISMDQAGKITEWNRQAELTFGWSRQEVLGRTVAQVIIPPERREAHVAGMQRFHSTGVGPVVNNRIEVQALHRDGHLIPIELSVAAIPEGGHFTATAFLHDISDRKAAAAKIESSERRLRDVTNNIPALVGYFDSDQRCTFANDPALKLYGLTRDSVTNMAMAVILGPENYAQHQPYVAEALRGRRTCLEGQAVLRGRHSHFQAHLIPDILDDGTVQGFYAMTFDITATKVAELARAAGEQRLRMITDNLPVLISYIDQEQRMQFCNGTFLRWMGVDPTRARGMHVAEVIGPVLYEQRQRQIAEALGGARVEFDLPSVDRGVERHLQTIYVPDKRDDGSVAGIYTMSTDVTELKKIEKQLSVLARYDSLTGLPNRRQFEEKLDEAVARAERTHKLMAVLFLDVDKFKSINDSLGHAAGDEVLKEFALRLTKCVRKTDTVARLAGDEFIVLLEGVNTFEEPQFVARKILAIMDGPFDVLGRELAVSTSIGIAVSPPGAHGTTQLLAMADEALYSAKAAGRGRFKCAPKAPSS